jgi:predicted Holliday junction resolvase-like endonuclease
LFDLVLPSLLLASLAFFAYFYFSRVNKNSSIDLEKILEREQKTKIEFEKKLELLQNQVITLKENNVKLDSSYLNLNSNYKDLESSSLKNVKSLEEQLSELSEEKRKIVSQKKSSEVRLGHIAETLAPFLDQFNFNPEHCIFLGRPIDYISFGSKEITFIEIKSGKSQLNSKQRLIRDQVHNKEVAWKEIRII